jgi:hypothetical protein
MWASGHHLRRADSIVQTNRRLFSRCSTNAAIVQKNPDPTRGDERIWSTPSPLILGPEAFPEVSIDLLCGVRGMDEETNAALDAVREVCKLPDVSSGVCLRPRDLLLIDNRKGARPHGLHRLLRRAGSVAAPRLCAPKPLGAQERVQPGRAVF